MSNPKFSIIIPTRNGGKYLPYCIQSVLSQQYQDFELIISNNNSSDNTVEILSSITDKRVKIINHTEEFLTMGENYESALNAALGQWIIILGDDDGLMPYFFEIADKLAQKAEKKNLDLINFERAFFYWNGCQELYNDLMLIYKVHNYYSIKCLFKSLFSIILGFNQYWDFPQIYTNGMFSKRLVDKVKTLQGGKFFMSNPPDCASAAIAQSFGRKFLHCNLPLAWVGTSPKSQGVVGKKILDKNAKLEEKNNEVKDIKTEWKLLGWDKSRFGEFELNSMTMLFYRALVYCDNIQSKTFKNLINSKFFKFLVCIGIMNEINYDCDMKNSAKKNLRSEYLKEICQIYEIKYSSVKKGYKYILPIARKFLRKSPILEFMFTKRKFAKKLKLDIRRNEENQNLTITDANKLIMEAVKNSDILNLI